MKIYILGGEEDDVRILEVFSSLEKAKIIFDNLVAEKTLLCTNDDYIDIYYNENYMDINSNLDPFLYEVSYNYNNCYGRFWIKEKELK